MLPSRKFLHSSFTGMLRKISGNMVQQQGPETLPLVLYTKSVRMHQQGIGRELRGSCTCHLPHKSET